MNSIISDTKFSENFIKPISNDYKTALQFLTVNPDYSLLKFREIVTCICNEIAEYKGVEFYGVKLFEQISNLFECQVIHKSFEGDLHEARVLCNTGVHKSNLPITPDNEKSFEEINGILKEKALRVRKLIVGIFEDAFLILQPNEKLPKVELIQAGEQEYKEILFNAASSQCYKEKLKAGIIYESLAEKHLLEAPSLVVPENYLHHQNYLYKNAAINYESSYKTSVDINKEVKSLGVSWSDFNQEDYILKYCSLEPLYKYSLIAHDGYLGDEHIEHGYELIKVAADRGYIQAVAYYGACLYHKKEYYSAKEYLDKAVEYDEPLAYRYLSRYYREGLACDIDRDLSLNFLIRWEALGCADSKGELGQAYHEGIIVKQDNEIAESYLNEAINLGSMSAKYYYIVEFNNLREEFTRRVMEFGKTLTRINDDSKPSPLSAGKKIKRNEACPCGSGLKYKKCCLH